MAVAVVSAAAPSAPAPILDADLVSHYNLWERTCANIGDRLPGKVGLEIWSILEQHVVDREVHIDFFHKRSDGSWDLTRPRMRRSATHQRPSERDNVDFCKKSINSVGFHQLGRGALIGDPDEVPAGDAAVLSGAHIVESMVELAIECAESGEENAMVTLSLRRGTTIYMLKPKVQPDIKEWIVVFFNSFGAGSGLGIAQCVQRRQKLSKRWDAYTDGRFSVGKCGGAGQLETLHRAWLRDHAHDDIFTGTEWKFYDATGVLINQLGDDLEPFLVWIGKTVSNRSRGDRISLPDIVRNVQEFDKILRMNYKDKASFSDTRYKALWYSCMMTCLPLADRPEFAQQRLIFTEYNARTRAIMHRLAEAMPEGKSVVLKIKTPKADKKGGGATSDIDITGKVELRPRKDCLFGDDMNEFLQKASVSLSSRGFVVDNELPHLPYEVFRMGLHMLFIEESVCCLRWSETVYTKWPALKRFIFPKIATECGDVIRSIRERAASARQSGVDPRVMSVDVVDLIEFRDAVTQQTNIKLQRPFIAFADSVKHRLADVDIENKEVHMIADIVLNEIDKLFKPSWAIVLGDILDAAQSDLRTQYGSEILAAFPKVTSVKDKDTGEETSVTTYDVLAILDMLQHRARYVYSAIASILLGSWGGW